MPTKRLTPGSRDHKSKIVQLFGEQPGKKKKEWGYDGPIWDVTRSNVTEVARHLEEPLAGFS